ncbi:extracellular solute-binding protein [Streptosporangium sp. NPDC006930]|uniref:extracellular solute-binding protein n=1 Tax=unclassified Streptosporangium TaxID=2632669 RepID=UPI0034432004
MTIRAARLKRLTGAVTAAALVAFVAACGSGSTSDSADAGADSTVTLEFAQWWGMKEQDKVEKFTNGQVGMVIDSLAHINLIKKNKPDLKFEIAALPAEDGYTGKRGIPYASWGIGISDSTGHKAEAFKFVSYLMSQETNAKLSTIANGFPGNSRCPV